MPLVKICGITRPEDAEDAFSLGADFLGIIFAKSKRQVNARQAGKIMEAVPTFQNFVGVFQDQSVEEVEETALRLGLEYVQLHGEETVEFCNSLKASGLRVIKVMHMGQHAECSDEMLKPYGAYGYLLDTKLENQRGGTGKAFDWKLIDPDLNRRFKLFLSGGLNCENVSQAIDVLHPFAVDVSSGVESQPGIKDFRLVREFIKRAKQDVK